MRLVAARIVRTYRPRRVAPAVTRPWVRVARTGHGDPRRAAGRPLGAVSAEPSGGPASELTGPARQGRCHGVSSNWMWVVVAIGAMAHALRWIPGNAVARQLKIPATFVLLYVVYAAALARGGLTGFVLSFLIVEVLLHLVRARRGERARTPGSGRR